MSLSRRISVAAASQVAGRLYTSALAFVITALVLPRQLAEHEFGIFAFYLTLYQLLTNVLDFGAGTIVVREASRDREAAGPLLGLLVLIKAVFAAVGVALLAVVALHFEGWGPRWWLITLAAVHLLFHAPAGAAAIFHVDMAFGRAVLATTSGQTVWLLGSVALALAGVARPAPYLLAYGAGTVVAGLLAWSWARRRVRVRFDAGRAALRRLWREAWPAGVSMAAASLYFYLDAVMLRPLAGEVAVAHYSAAYRLMAFVLMVPVLFSQVVFPVFSRLHAPGGERLQPFFRRTLGLLFALGVVFPATVPAVAVDVMALVFPPAYGVASTSLAILSLAIVFVFCAYPHILALLAAGKQRVMMVLSLVGAALNVALNLWWIPTAGIEGAAWATVVTEAFIALSAAVAAARLAGVALAPASLLRPIACAALAGVALHVLLGSLDGAAPVLRVGAGVAAGLLAVSLCGVFPLDLGDDGAQAGGEASRP